LEKDFIRPRVEGCVRRRDFIRAVASSAVAWPLGALGQQTSKVWRVGMLETTSATLNAVNVDAFRRGLRQLGYVEGQNLIIEYRSGEGRIDRFPELAAEMVRLKVDIIVTRGTPAALAAKNATATIPIVMAAIGEPLGTGIVLSLAQPGGNVTDLSAFVNELAAKRIEIMREIVPKILRMAMIDNMGNASVPPQWDEIKRATLAFGIQPQLYDVRRPEDIGPAFDAAIAQQVDALTVGNDSVFIASRLRVVELAAKHRLPAIYATREFVDAGGLLSYAANYPDLYRRSTSYIDKIFKGAKPGELPVEQPTKLELIINIKTAKALGLDVPFHIQQRADEMIE
jgi:putative tryptophan/tyrosine transport system substrate-binding protein